MELQRGCGGFIVIVPVEGASRAEVDAIVARSRSRRGRADSSDRALVAECVSVAAKLIGGDKDRAQLGPFEQGDKDCRGGWRIVASTRRETRVDQSRDGGLSRLGASTAPRPSHSPRYLVIHLKGDLR
jgi:hypothetical protein